MTWNVFKDLKTQAKEKTEEFAEYQKEIDRYAYRTFSTVDGKKFLEFLTSTTVDRPSYSGGSIEGIASTLVREGENRVIREIQLRIKRAPLHHTTIKREK